MQSSKGTNDAVLWFWENGKSKKKGLADRKRRNGFTTGISTKSRTVLPAIKPSLPRTLRDFHHSQDNNSQNVKSHKLVMARDENGPGFACRKFPSFQSCLTSDHCCEEETGHYNSPSESASEVRMDTAHPPKKTMTFPEYKQKFDELVAEIMETLNCVEDLKVRSQLEFLLSEFRNMLLTEGSEQDRSLNAQFLDDIRTWLKGLDTENNDKIMNNQDVKVVNVSAAIKLQEARELQRQVGEIHSYFNHMSKIPELCEVLPSCTSTSMSMQDQLPKVPLSSELCDVAKECWTDCPSMTSQGDPAEIDNLLAQMQALSDFIDMRERKIAALSQSNALLTKQIGEVQNTLEASDRYLEAVRKQGPPLENDTLRKEMCAFQESMIESIINFIDILYQQLEPLQKKEIKQSERTSVLFANYKKLKREEDALDAEIAKEGTKDVPEDNGDIFDSDSLASNADLFVAMKAVVCGIDIFQKTCKDIWEEALQRMSEETEALLKSRKKATPHEVMAADLKKLKCLRQDDSKYSETSASALKMLETIASDFSHLMILTRLKDLQLISIDHKIGVVYLTLKRKAALKAVQSQCSDDAVKEPPPAQVVDETSSKKKQTKANPVVSHIVPKATKRIASTTSSGVKSNAIRKVKTSSALPQTNFERENFTGVNARTNHDSADQHPHRANTNPLREMHMASAAELKIPLDFSMDTVMIGVPQFISAGEKIMSPWTPLHKINTLRKPLGRSDTICLDNSKFFNNYMDSSFTNAPNGPAKLMFHKISQDVETVKEKSVPRVNITFAYPPLTPSRDSLPLIQKKNQNQRNVKKEENKTGKITSPKSRLIRKTMAADDRPIHARSDNRIVYDESQYSSITQYNTMTPSPVPPPIKKYGKVLQRVKRVGQRK